jgi:hypothetical protein
MQRSSRYNLISLRNTIIVRYRTFDDKAIDLKMT